MQIGELYEAITDIDVYGIHQDLHIHKHRFRLTGQEPHQLERGIIVWAAVDIETGEKRHFTNSHFETLLSKIDENSNE